MQDNDAPDLLFVDEVAAKLRRSVDAVRWLINTKQLKAAKLGGRVVVRRADLEAFIDAAFAEVS
ncbi:helix-turn-helix domain-containing protein [Microbacterium allomyrinae]|uniref:Helix-turn-helix domain-containing protein n=1 Tax=Microbacterium allomyrinae TaxID=2830666 RepID=A0A9X1LV24_9MICO|nr:helix-turn-helix domain-containing protein [Microbacterium allomyrinae]MCC2032183.1 helix-turn-helix domain-containing protein [Microbacterium allomyrinae]